MDDDAIDDVEEVGLVINVSCVDWMMRWIGCISRELYLSTYTRSSLYS
jgi:hypothetical protein